MLGKVDYMNDVSEKMAGVTWMVSWFSRNITEPTMATLWQHRQIIWLNTVFE